MCVVPDAPARLQRRAIDCHGPALHSPRPQHDDHVAPTVPNESRQTLWQLSQATFPGAARGTPALLLAQAAQRAWGGVVLFQKRQQAMSRVEAANHHDD